MAVEARIGRMLFAAAMVAFGVQALLFSKSGVGLQPGLISPAPAIVAIGIDAAVLILAGLALTTDRLARAAALVLAALYIGSMIVLQGPALIAQPKAAADDVFHTLAIGSAALILAGLIPRALGRGGRGDAAGGLIGRLIFGVCTIGHGVMHFVFFKFTADFIPAWIPQHEFWAAATGLAQIAAGLAILSGLLAGLAATLCAVMYGSWALIVHIPRIMAHPVRQEWHGIVVATALCASALIVAGALGGARRPVTGYRSL